MTKKTGPCYYCGNKDTEPYVDYDETGDYWYCHRCMCEFHKPSTSTSKHKWIHGTEYEQVMLLKKLAKSGDLPRGTLLKGLLTLQKRLAFLIDIAEAAPDQGWKFAT